MSDAGSDMIVLGFPDYREPAMRLARKLQTDYADVHIHRFPDGESLVRLPERVAAHAILFCSLDDANRRLIELELAAVTALGLGAKTLTLIAPYLCYMRQDRAFHPGEAVSQHIVGELLARHINTLITVDPHLHRTHKLADAVPVGRALALSAAPLMTAWLGRLPEAPLLIGPDEESEQWVRAIAAPAGLDYAVAHKTRVGDRDVRIELPERRFDSRAIVLIDDVVSTGQTLVEAARQIAGRGAKSIAALVTHALFVDAAEKRLREAGVSEICSTDSVMHPSNRLHLDELLAAALRENGIMPGARMPSSDRRSPE